ncbi:MAG: type IV pilus assembly protein PilM [Candidatus Dadabacteria bacterium]|nr:MAG: type IV pilus assembly protein PilM [Candidatus Dadabacteria bacterium]
MFKSKQKTFIGLDIGSSSVKMVELDCSGAKPALLSMNMASIPGNAFLNNAVSNKEVVAEKVHSVIGNRNIEELAAVVAMPAPSAFTKKITLPDMDPGELKATIEFEAGSYIPHGLDAVRMDYCILGKKESGEFEVLLVAVKNEIVDSFLDVMARAGIEVGVIDIDYFALQGAYEVSYPDLIDKTVALIDIGARFSFINICKLGKSLFTGNISVGGLELTHEIARTLGIELNDAEAIKKTLKDGDYDEELTEVVQQNRSSLVSELDRQIRLMWNASGADEDIDHILLSGGGAQVPGIAEELLARTGIPTEIMDPLKGISIGGDFDIEYINEMRHIVGIAVGLALRRSGDRGATVYE